MKNNLPYNVMANKTNNWDNVPRYAAVIGFLTTTVGMSALAANIIYAVGATLISSALYKALSPKTKQGLLTNIRDAAAPVDIVYGQVRKGGVITYLESTGTDNKYLHMFIALAGHEVESIGDIYVNDKVASFSGNNITTATDGTDTDNWNSKIYVQKFTGASGQDIYTSLSGLSAKPTIDASFTGDNIACLYVRLTYDVDTFASGIPTITAVVKGKKVLNTSGVPQTYPASANAALCIRDYLTNYYGLDTPTSTVDDTAFGVAATDCDDDVALSGGGTEKRYTINGVISTGQSLQQNLDSLVAACGGSLFYSQGKFKLVAGVYNSSVKTLTIADLRSPIQLSTRVSRRDNFNSVYGTFNDAGQDWVEADFPPILSTGAGSFLEEDNGYDNPLDIDLPLTTSSATAQRLAKLTLFRAREQMAFSAEFGMEAFDLEVGDTVSLTLERYGWTTKEFEVVEWGLRSDQDGGDLRVLLTLRETSSAAFSWSAEETDLTANNTSLPSPTSTESVSFGATTVGSEVDNDGTTLPFIKFSWSVTDESNVDYYDFQWKLTTDSDYNSVQTKETSFKLSPALSLVDYDYRIRSVNHLGVRSAFTTASAVTTVKDDTVPNPPTSITVEGSYGSAKVKWIKPTTNTDGSALKDLGSYKVFRGTSTNPTVQVARVSANVFTDVGLADNQTYYYRVKAEDLSGNKSAYSTNGSGTTSVAPAGEAGADGADGARGAGRWNIGVTTLPTTSSGADTEFTSAIGDPVDQDQAWFYTGDEESPLSQNVWIYDLGTDTWTEQTEAVDGDLVVSGTITGTKLAANTITAGNMNVTSLAAISAVLGDVTINKTLTMENANSSFIGGKSSAGDLYTSGYYFGRKGKGIVAATSFETGKTYEITTVGTTDFVTDFGADSNTVGEIFISTADGTGTSGTGYAREIGFELTVSSDGATPSAITISDDRGINLINPTLWTGTPSSSATVYSSDGKQNIGVVDSITVTAVGGGGGGGRGSNRYWDSTFAAGSDGTSTTVQVYDGDPDTTGTLQATITAIGGAGGLSNQDSLYKVSGTAGESSPFGTGGSGGGFQTDGANGGIGAGGGGGGYADYVEFGTFKTYYGDSGEGGSAGEFVTQTIDTSGFSNSVYVVLTKGTGGAGATPSDSGAGVGGNGGDGYMAVLSDFSGLTEITLDNTWKLVDVLYDGSTDPDVQIIGSGILDEGYEYRYEWTNLLLSTNTSILAMLHRETANVWHDDVVDQRASGSNLNYSFGYYNLINPEGKHTDVAYSQAESVTLRYKVTTATDVESQWLGMTSAGMAIAVEGTERIDRIELKAASGTFIDGVVKLFKRRSQQ